MQVARVFLIIIFSRLPLAAAISVLYMAFRISNQEAIFESKLEFIIVASMLTIPIAIGMGGNLMVIFVVKLMRREIRARDIRSAADLASLKN